MYPTACGGEDAGKVVLGIRPTRTSPLALVPSELAWVLNVYGRRVPSIITENFASKYLEMVYNSSSLLDVHSVCELDESKVQNTYIILLYSITALPQLERGHFVSIAPISVQGHSLYNLCTLIFPLFWWTRSSDCCSVWCRHTVRKHSCVSCCTRARCFPFSFEAWKWNTVIIVSTELSEFLLAVFRVKLLLELFALYNRYVGATLRSSIHFACTLSCSLYCPLLLLFSYPRYKWYVDIEL